ncbi:MAG: hypothetical protein IJ794_02160 [Lachnospiraceae bacterium]|nr:hypothetical protein [Lachnospiraceae bacterium]
MQQTPLPEDSPLSVTGFVTNNGELCGYHLSNDSFVSCEDGIKMADCGLLKGVFSPKRPAPGKDHP